nr:unnamed protein product [Callosobruchus chinensis]
MNRWWPQGVGHKVARLSAIIKCMGSATDGITCSRTPEQNERIAAVASAQAGHYGGYDDGHSARGALEGALGGQWIPDVPVHHGVGAGIIGHAGILGAGIGHAGIVAPGALGLGLGYGAGHLGLGLAHGHASRGALEGALGGQWIPDTLEHGHGHGK